MMEFKVGAEPVMVKMSAFETGPLPPDWSTVTCAVLAELTKLESIVAVSWLAVTNVVGWAAPFHFTIESGNCVKPLPLTVSVKPPELA